MSFKKIDPELISRLGEKGIESPNPFQAAIIPKIKSGVHVYGIGEKGCGKTTTILLSVLNKLKMAPKGDNPRAVIFVQDRKAALELEEQFVALTRYTDLRILPIYEEGDWQIQKNLIYPGIDILIATPKRFAKLYFLNGINLNELEMLIIEDADFLISSSAHTDINRITESLKKGQFLVFASKFEGKVKALKELFMARSVIVKG
ncbi:MAG: DEAD/DEAH box helicase [Crocinitomicaceae bacterium]